MEAFAFAVATSFGGGLNIKHVDFEKDLWKLGSKGRSFHVTVMSSNFWLDIL